MIEVLLRKLRCRDQITEAEERVLRSVLQRQKHFSAGQVIVEAGDELRDSMCLVEGCAYRFKDLRDGQRQVLELSIAGDFIDLHGFLLKRLDHSIQALSPCRLALVSHADLRQITENEPRLARVLWFQTTLDGAIHREWVTSLGRRSAVERIAHLFCELKVRLGIVGLTNGNSFELPISQSDLSDFAGLSPVHTNRSLQALRKQGLLTFSRGSVRIDDFDGLAELAGFDPGYLYLEDENRAASLTAQSPDG